jgi:hypothetical protein
MTDVDELERAERDAAAEVDAAEGSVADLRAESIQSDDGASRLTSADYSTAFTPRNLAVGLAIVAGVVAFIASRRRRRGTDEIR